MNGFGAIGGLGTQIHAEIVLRKRVFIFLTVFEVGLRPGGWDGVNPIKETILRKRAFIFLTVFAVGLGPGRWDGVKFIGKWYLRK